jgi:hypothetical protein
MAGLLTGLPAGLPQLCVLLPVLLHHLALLPKGPSALSAIQTKSLAFKRTVQRVGERVMFFRHLIILTCKGTLRQVLIRVYRLVIQSVMLVFSTQLYEMLPLYPSLWLALPPPLP